MEISNTSRMPRGDEGEYDPVQDLSVVTDLNGTVITVITSKR